MNHYILGGADTIGGNCIEIESQGYRLLLDLGIPLGLSDEENLTLPNCSALWNGDDPKFLGVVISHGHRDHYGLATKAHASTKYFIGEKAYQILRTAAWFMRQEINLGWPTFLYHRVPITIGPFTITPHLVDHSGFDAYAFLVEADGQKLFYTGDIRGHGRKARLFNDLICSGPKNVDVLISEGTNLNRAGVETKTEQALEADIHETIKNTRGIVLAWFSPQNIDRLVTIYKAAIQAGRIFIMDLYAASILDAINCPSLPRASWEKVRVYVPEQMRWRIKREGRFDLVNPYRTKRIYRSELADNPEKFVIMFRPSMFEELFCDGCLAGGGIVYSMWHGYLLNQYSAEAYDQWKSVGLSFSEHHTSGHASPAQLNDLITALQPRKVEWIHTEGGV